VIEVGGVQRSLIEYVKGSWHCLINLSFMRIISRYNNNEIPLTSSTSSSVSDVPEACNNFAACLDRADQDQVVALLLPLRAARLRTGSATLNQ
jgi:hypothetical protein